MLCKKPSFRIIVIKALSPIRDIPYFRTLSLTMVIRSLHVILVSHSIPFRLTPQSVTPFFVFESEGPGPTAQPSSYPADPAMRTNNIIDRRSLASQRQLQPFLSGSAFLTTVIPPKPPLPNRSRGRGKATTGYSLEAAEESCIGGRCWVGGTGELDGLPVDTI